MEQEKKKRGLKKGTTNNPNGRPVGSKNKASANTKEIIAGFFLKEKEGKTRLEKILEELDIGKKNGLDLDYKISTSFKYIRFIASISRDDVEVDAENKVKNALYDKFFGKNKES